MDHIFTPLEQATLSTESKAKLEAALVRAFVQGASYREEQFHSGRPLTPLARGNAETEVTRLSAAGTLGREESVPF